MLSALRHSARVARVSNVRMASCARDIPADRQADLAAKVEAFKSHVSEVRVAGNKAKASLGLWWWWIGCPPAAAVDPPTPPVHAVPLRMTALPVYRGTAASL